MEEEEGRKGIPAFLKPSSSSEGGSCQEHIASAITQLIGWTPLIELKHITKKDGINTRIIGKIESYQPLCSIKDRSALRLLASKLVYASSSQCGVSQRKQELDHQMETKATDERASSCYYSSSSAVSLAYEDALNRSNSKQRNSGVATVSRPPPAQQMDLSSDPEDGRIPGEVFEREASAKDWSMISTDSVFGIQVAPSGHFTGFFAAHPELMDISTPPRISSANEAVLAPHFESMPEVVEITMNGNYSFAFPNLIEDKRYGCKKPQEEQRAAAVSATTEAAMPAEASSKPREAPERATVQGGWLSCLPCCSS